MNYLLTPKQKYLLKFNKKHVVDIESEDNSVESADSMLSYETKDGDRQAAIKKRVMVKLLQYDRD